MGIKVSQKGRETGFFWDKNIPKYKSYNLNVLLI